MATDSEYEIALNEYSSKATKATAKSATASRIKHRFHYILLACYWSKQQDALTLLKV